jgi:RNA polymerase sigma factor (sigma-70 family)
VMARQELQQLEQAIAQLPEGCRAVLLLRKLELLSHREIAGRLGIAISTVEKQHARALRLLRANLATRPPAVEPAHQPEVKS